MYEILQIGLGPRSWESAQSLLHALGPFENIGLWIMVGSVLYHGGNGIRLILNEAFGMLLGKPTLPVYPYAPTSLGRNQKLAMWTINLATLLLWIWAGLYLLAGLGLMK
jgi:succinate dehydrogenase/fumarate reductase cytochrome b subunit